MNIPDFATVLTSILRHNQALLANGAAVKDYLVPIAWGDPGLGKSDIAEAVADDLGLDLIYADLATRDPAELAGIPWVKDGHTIGCRPDWLPESGNGILFLDELPQAGIANLNIAATLIREHRIGEHRLPESWMVVCAGNHLPQPGRHDNHAQPCAQPAAASDDRCRCQRLGAGQGLRHPATLA